MGRKIRVLIAIPRDLYARLSRTEDEDKLREFADVEFNPYNRNLNEDELANFIKLYKGC